MRSFQLIDSPADFGNLVRNRINYTKAKQTDFASSQVSAKKPKRKETKDT